jgi:hypothetical protein
MGNNGKGEKVIISDGNGNEITARIIEDFKSKGPKKYPFVKVVLSNGEEKNFRKSRVKITKIN